MTSKPGPFAGMNGAHHSEAALGDSSLRQLPPGTQQQQQQQHAQSTRSITPHVPLLPRKPDTGTSTTIRPQIAAATQARQRVRRACLECRTKKVKCDGSETCSRCASYSIVCEYVEFSASSIRAPNVPDTTTQVEKLESRVASMEQMFRQFLDQFQSNQTIRDASYHTGAATLPAQDETADPAFAINEPSNRPVTETPPREETLIAQVTPHVNKIQQLLDAAGLGTSIHEGDSNSLEEDIENTVEEAHVYDPHEYHETDFIDGRGRRYADGFGELDVDSHGQLRYVGLGSTASVAVENCIGLRRYITEGLEKRGYETEETFFTSPEATHFEEAADTPSSQVEELRLPPAKVVEVLVSVYVRELVYLFPITTEKDIWSGYQKLLLPGAWDHGHAAAFFAILAAAAPLVSADSVVFDRVGRKWASAGPVFYNQAMRFVNLPLDGKSQRKERSQDIVVALGLLSMYLAETGSQAEAWISAGRAIRIAQDIGLHRSPERLRLPRAEWNKRRYVWWCLYILERQLCTALGRPLSINDEDCDTEIPTFGDESPESDFAGFTSMIHLHQIIGTILKIVNSVKNANAWRNAADNGMKEELQSRVRKANDALQTWAKDMVPPHIKTAKSGIFLAEKHIALSSFFSAVMLLHRVFIRNPHRPSPLVGSQAQLKSAKAATDCIRGTAEFFRCVPMSHFMVFHGQYVFVSALILLSCIRWSDDPKFVYQALRDVEDAMQVLQSLEKSWKGARKCRGTVEEYLEFTFKVLQGDRKCRFDCEYGYQPHDTRKCQPAKRRLSEPAGAKEPKKSRLAGTVHQGKPSSSGHDCSTGILPTSEKHKSLVSSGNPGNLYVSSIPKNISSADGLQPTSEDTCFFDNTINNFLGAIDPDGGFHDHQFDMSLGIDFNGSGLAFLSPDHDGRSLQNSFF